MKLLDIKDYDITNYKKPSMFLIFPNCNFKCGIEECQNYQLSFEKILNISKSYILELYNKNPLTKAVVCGGLEPFDDFEDLYHFIQIFRQYYQDDIVIYTGYNSYEILPKLKMLCEFNNIIIKFGRYIPNQTPHYDNTLGVDLASDNQFATYLNQNSIDIINSLIDNHGYCPCSLIQDENTKCCCKNFRDTGECICGLYTKESKG